MTPSLPPSTCHVSRIAWRRTVGEQSVRIVPEETPVALTYDGSTYAVMMATPEDLEDFAIGFSLSEGVIRTAEEVRSLDIVVVGAGIEARMWLAPDAGRSLATRRRLMTGPTGCGLCGIESLEQAVMPPPHVDGGFQLQAADLVTAMSSLAPRQRLNIETRAVHAAAFWEPRGGIVALREDVGRHNALDKVVGALACTNRGADGGMILLTSRVSVEMVQKTARLGAPVLAAVSAPTALALRMADAAGITLVAIAREDGFEIFTHPERIEQGASRHVA